MAGRHSEQESATLALDDRHTTARRTRWIGTAAVLTAVALTGGAAFFDFGRAGADDAPAPRADTAPAPQVAETPTSIETLAAVTTTLAARPQGDGHWVVNDRGEVTPFGAAPALGNVGDGWDPAAGPVPVVRAMAVTPSGDGYWLLSAEGHVITRGDATFHGAGTGREHGSDFVAITPTADGSGYYLLESNGGVHNFGAAEFKGSAPESDQPATGLVLTDDGYTVSRADGSTVDLPLPVPVRRPAGGGGGPSALGADAFLACTRAHESDTAGGYRAVSPGGTYRGAYQFLPSTWNNTARHAGRDDLVGVDPAAASPADQDAIALHLYQWQGKGPWGGRC